MGKFILLFCVSLLSLNLTAATNRNWDDTVSNEQPTPKRQGQIKSASAPGDASAISCNQGKGESKTMVVACDLTTYQSAIKLAPDDFPYTSGSGITVSATSNTETLSNTTYTCGGNAFATSPTAWWLDDVNDLITLTFSAPVTSLSVVVNGTNNGEIFTFNAATGTISLDNFCTASFATAGAGNQLQCITSPGTFGTLVTLNNPTGSTVYTFTHNGLLAGSRISLLDCYVADPLPVVDPKAMSRLVVPKRCRKLLSRALPVQPSTGPTTTPRLALQPVVPAT